MTAENMQRLDELANMTRSGLSAGVLGTANLLASSDPDKPAWLQNLDNTAAITTAAAPQIKQLSDSLVYKGANYVGLPMKKPLPLGEQFNIHLQWQPSPDGMATQGMVDSSMAIAKQARKAELAQNARRFSKLPLSTRRFIGNSILAARMLPKAIPALSTASFLGDIGYGLYNRFKNFNDLRDLANPIDGLESDGY